MNSCQFVTPELLSACRSIPVCLPQTDIGPQRSIIVGSWHIPAGQMAVLTWSCVHLVEIRPIEQSSGLVQASKNDSTVTATEDFFTPDLVGSLIIWSNGSRAIISSYTSPLSVQVTTVGVQYAAAATVSLSYFSIIPATPDLVNTANDVISFGLMSNGVDLISLPAGRLNHTLSLREPGVLALGISHNRAYFGPTNLSLVVVNNARNFSAQVSATAHLKHKTWA